MLTAKAIFDITDKSCKDYVRGFRNHKRFVSEFREQYSYIRAYHATRLNAEELDTIARNGLTVASVDLMKQKAKARFIRTSDPTETQNQISLEIDNFFLEPTHENGKIYFATTRKILETKSYQYLLFGPESLVPLAYKLRDRFHLPFKKRMVEFGEPHIVCANIPVSNTDDIYIKGIFECVRGKHWESPLTYFEDVPSEYIVEIIKTKCPPDLYNLEFI